MTLTVHEHMLQGSDDWLKARRGLLTASTIGALLTTRPPAGTSYACPVCSAGVGDSCVSIAKNANAGKPVKALHPGRVELASENPDDIPDRIVYADSDKSRALVAQIVAERLTEWEDPQWTNGDMERGHQVEPIARDWYAQKEGVEVRQVGFMVLQLDDGVQVGYSPDGLIGDDGLLEVKAPRAKRHVLSHITGTVPDEHMAQCQTGMFVSGRSWVDFLSYVGGEPPFLTRVHADPDWFEAIENAARHFEQQAAEMADKYRAATAGLPATDRLPDPYDAGIVI